MKGIVTETTEKPENVFEWMSHPASERPWATIAYVSIILLAGLLAAMVMGNNLWWGLVFAFVLFLSGWTYFLPIRFRMNDEGVIKKSLFGTERMTWTQVRSIIPDRYGVLLSPFPQPTRLAKFRGMSVQFSGNREDVLEYIRTHSTGKP